MSLALSCPFCNSSFSLDAAPASRRVICPRCGDTFPLRGEVDDHAGPPGNGPAASSIASTPAAPRSWLTLPRVLAISVLLGLVGFAAGTYFYDKPPPKPAGPKLERALLPPAKLEALKYLPAETNLVFAVQPNPILTFAASESQDPRVWLTAAGVPARVFSTLDTLGIPLPQIDHVAVGSTVDDDAVALRFTLVLVLREPLADEENFLRTLEARRTTIGDRTFYQVNLAGVPGVLAWKAAPTVWVFGNGERDVPAPGGPGLASSSLKQMIETRLSPATAVWAAADEGRWAEKPGVRFAAKVLKQEDAIPVLAKGRAAAIGISFEETPRLRLFIRTANDEAGASLRETLQSQGGNGGSVGGAGDWALIDWRLDANDPFKTIKAAIDNAMKK